MKVRLGMSPISWTNDDLPELGGDTSLETCLRETRDAGFTGTELGGKFPRDKEALKKILDQLATVDPQKIKTISLIMIIDILFIIIICICQI